MFSMPNPPPDTPAINRRRIVADLRALGLEPGDAVLAHTSLRSLGRVEGGAETVVQGIIEVVAPDGTILFPAHTGHPGINPENPPVFDVRTSPTLNIGVVPEAARLRPDARRSLQPTHSVTAFGGQAEWFIEGHEFCDTPCGYNSPYEKLKRAGGKILLLGCDHESNTTLHALEEAANVPYHMLTGVGTMKITDANGVERQLPGRFHRWGVPRHFMRWDAEFTRLGIQRTGRVGNAETRLVDAAAMWEYVLELLKNDPCALLPEDYVLPKNLGRPG